MQYIILVLQCLRHALHCNFGSTLIISHSLVFPAAIIATFDSSLKKIEWSMLFEIILNCFFLSMTFNFLNQVMNADALRAFHRRIGNTGDVEVNVLVIHCKTELIRIITIFEMTIFLQFVQSFLSIGLPRSIVILDAFFFLSIEGCPDLSEELSSSCNLPTISWVTGCPVRSSMGLGNWVGLEEPG